MLRFTRRRNSLNLIFERICSDLQLARRILAKVTNLFVPQFVSRKSINSNRVAQSASFFIRFNPYRAITFNFQPLQMNFAMFGCNKNKTMYRIHPRFSCIKRCLVPFHTFSNNLSMLLLCWQNMILIPFICCWAWTPAARSSKQIFPKNQIFSICPQRRESPAQCICLSEGKYHIYWRYFLNKKPFFKNSTLSSTRHLCQFQTTIRIWSGKW